MSAVRCLRCGVLFVSGSAYLHPGHSCVSSSELAASVERGMLEVSSVSLRRFRVVEVCEE